MRKEEGGRQEEHPHRISEPPAEPDPIPEVEFDQSLPDDFDL